MKTITLFIAAMLMLTVASCTNSDNDLLEESTLFESIKNAYGAENTSVSLSGSEKIPFVSLDEMQAVLEAFRKDSNQKKKCLVETVKGSSFGGQNEQNKKVIMGSQFAAVTRAGSTLEDFLLRVELKFNYDNNQVFYYGTDYMYDSQLFDWRANGLSLSPVKNAAGLIYEFESESFLYFRVKEEGGCLVKVGIVFKGEFDFKSETGTYSFQLQKYSK